MNMLIRYMMLLLLLKQQKSTNFPKPPVNDTIVSEYRVLPHDMGWRSHLPNYRYLSFMELNVTKWLRQQTGGKDIHWIISAQQWTYLKEVMFLDKMTVKSQVLGWSERYVYFRHEFFVKHQLMTISITKLALMGDGKVLPTTVIFDKPEKTHPVITTWLENQQEIKQMTQQPL